MTQLLARTGGSIPEIDIHLAAYKKILGELKNELLDRFKGEEPDLFERMASIADSSNRPLRVRLRDHFPTIIRFEYIISNAWGPTLISPRNGLSKAPKR
jgi:hypothetical protein